MPISGLLSGWLLLDEALSPAGWLACVIVFVGLAITVLPKGLFGRLVSGSSRPTPGPEDRAVGAVIALAVVHQLLQGVAQAGQLGDLAVQLVDMVAGQRLDVGTGAAPVLPQLQQLADFLQ